MTGNDRQNQISPASPSALPSSHLFTRSHMLSDHFFSYDSATTVGPSDQYQLQKSIFQLRLWSDSQLRFHPRRPTTVRRKLLRGDAARRTQIQIAGFSLPLLRSQSEHGRRLAQSCSRTKISPGNPPSLPRRRSQIQNRLLSRLLPAPFSIPAGPRPQPSPKLQPEQYEHHEG